MGDYTLKESLLELFTVPVSLSTRNEIQDRILASVATLTGTNNVKTNVDRSQLVGHFRNSASPQKQLAVQCYVDQLIEHVVPHSINMASPRCLGHMSGGVPEFVRQLDHLLVVLNQNLVKAEASPSFTLLERQTLAILHRFIYGLSDDFYDQHIQDEDSSLGILTSGGTLSNITALWIARNGSFSPINGFAGVEEDGMTSALQHDGYKGAAVIGSHLMHYSIEKAVSILGIGARNLIKIQVDHQNRIVTSELRRAIAECQSRQVRVVAIVGVAGSTDCGSIDPLLDMADIANEAKVHFHVDAAWGMPFLFSALHRKKLSGIERADSITVDFHKQMYLPMGSSMLLLRNPAAAKTIEKQTGYILHEGAGDLGRRSLEGSRRGTILNIHAALNVIGSDGYAFLADENIRKARFMADLVARAPEFELLVEPETNIVLYRYIPETCREALASGALNAEDNLSINAVNEQIQKAQYQAGRTYVSRTKLSGVCWRYPVPIVALRAVVANPLTREDDIRLVLEDQLMLASETSKTRIDDHRD